MRPPSGERGIRDDRGWSGKWVGRYAGFCSRNRFPSTAISLGTTLPQPSSDLPDTSASSLNGVCLTLLRARFTQRARSLGPLVVSYTTVSPLPLAEACGGLLSVALSRGFLRVGVTHRPALWSPDVPRRGRSPFGASPRRDRLAGPLAASGYAADRMRAELCCPMPRGTLWLIERNKVRASVNSAPVIRADAREPYPKDAVRI